jgi:hypothetical protein
VPIAGLVSGGVRPNVDVEVRVGAQAPLLREPPPPLDVADYVDPYRDPKGDPALVVWEVGAGRSFFRLRYADGIDFLVSRSGNEVWAAWPEPLTLDDAAAYLLGPILAFVLRLRGTVSLHASVIALDGRAVVLAGHRGAGKSTTAAAFARRGTPVLSDDVAPLDAGDAGIYVRPGYPRLRLWSESVKALFGAPDVLPRLTPNLDKQYLNLGDHGLMFQETPLPLGAVYFLGERSAEPRAPFVESILGQQRLLELVGNTYGTYLLDECLRAKSFELLGMLAQSVPVRRVVPHQDPARLPALCQTIIDDFFG